MSDEVFNENTLRGMADVVIEEATRLAPTKDLKKTGVISAEIVHRKSGQFGILFTVDTSESGAPEGRAFEYGSGIHATIRRRSPKQAQVGGTILIKPVRKKVLAFRWDMADVEALEGSRIGHWKRRKDGVPSGEEALPSYAGQFPDGRLAFNWVRHPGVRPANQGRGYLGLAVQNTKESFSGTMLEGATNRLLSYVRRRFPKK